MSELEPLFPSTPANAITVVTVTQKSDQSEEEKREEEAAAAATTAEMDHEQQLEKVWSCDFFFLSNFFFSLSCLSLSLRV